MHKNKERLKSWLLPSNVFSDMGLYYLGPVDGHDLEQLENAIRLARDLRHPVLLHVLTKKGCGCDYAERHPDKYHGVGRRSVSAFPTGWGNTSASLPSMTAAS